MQTDTPTTATASADQPELQAVTNYSIVVPAFNEAGNVGALLHELFSLLEVIPPREIVVVDDGSTDGTVDEVCAQMSAHSALKLLRHSVCSGKSAAMVSGARQTTGDWIAFFDGDGQNDPQYLPEMLRQALANVSSDPRHVGLVAGVRAKRGDGSSRRYASRIANAIRQSMLRDGCPDSGCGLKLVHRDVFLAMPFFDGMHRFLPALAAIQGYRTALVSVVDRPRGAGASKYTNFGRAVVGVFDLLGVYWLRRRSSVPSAGVLPCRTEEATSSESSSIAGGA